MSCPTCGHTMHRIDTVPEAGPLYWCPRCGTLHRPMKDNHPPDTSAPALVGRCRTFERDAVAFAPAEVGVMLRRLGITEAINPPGDRP